MSTAALLLACAAIALLLGFIFAACRVAGRADDTARRIWENLKHD